MSVAFRADPDRIIAQFHGNLGAIQQAAMSGQLDPTAAVLAGMKLKSAQNEQGMQQGNPMTVAHDVFTPPAPMNLQAPAPAGPPAGGLGATPPAAGAGMVPSPPSPPPSQGTPDMGAPPQGMAMGGEVGSFGGEGAPQPYQSGGLTGIPVPDTMFDENRNGGFNDGYAGGGLVAFGAGGDVDPSYDQWKRAIIQQENGGKYTGTNQQGSGAMGKYQLMPATARAHAERLGMTYDPRMLTADTPEARKYQDTLGEAALRDAWDHSGGDIGKASAYYQAGPTKQGGPNNRKYVADINARLGGMEAGNAPATPERDMQTAQGRHSSLWDNIDLAQGLVGDQPHEARDKAKAYYEQELDPEKQKKDKKQDMWMALAEMGGNLASTPGPLLAALGSSIARTLPSITESAKERKAAEREAINGLMQVEDLDRKDAKDVVELGKDLWTSDMTAEEKKTQIAAEIEMRKADNKAAMDREQVSAATQIRVAGMHEDKQKQEIETAVKQHKQFIIGRIRSGLPIYNPNTGNVVWWRGSGLPAQSVIDELAHTAAIMDYRAARSDDSDGSGMQGLMGNVGPTADARKAGKAPPAGATPPADNAAGNPYAGFSAQPVG